MASPAEIFRTANLNIFLALGDIAIYIPIAREAFGVHALVSSSLQPQPGGLNSETWAQQTTVELLLSEFGEYAPSPGDVVDFNGDEYRLVVPTENDGLIVKFTAEKE